MLKRDIWFRSLTHNFVFLLGVIVAAPVFNASAETLQWQQNSDVSVNLWIQALLGGQSQKFLLDTGAQWTSIPSTVQSLTFDDLGPTGMLSAAGKTLPCEWVTAPGLRFDTILWPQLTINRCAGVQYRLGIDALNKTIFSLKFSDSTLSILQTLDASVNMAPLTRLVPGQFALPVTIGSIQTNGMFDTGWSISAVDIKLIASHPEIFSPVDKTLIGTDADGMPFEITEFHATDFRVGDLDFGPQTVQAYDFSKLEMVFGSNTSVIVGTSTMIGADWIFNLRDNTWSATLRAPSKRSP